MLGELLKPQTDLGRNSRDLEQIYSTNYSTSIAQALSPLVLLFGKLPLDEGRRNHQLYQDEDKCTLTKYLNAEMSLVARGNCKISFSITCIFFL